MWSVPGAPRQESLVTVLNPVSRERSSGRSGTQKKKIRRRFFISYRRSEEASRALAEALRRSLEDANHETFIDTSMEIGTDWVDEIAKRIQWCDYLIVLLSEESRTSEMVQAEVRLAHYRRKREDKPEILPVRVGYTGYLDYELDAYIGRIQYVLWRTPEDTTAVTEQILDKVVGASLRSEVVRPEPPARQKSDPKRPQPKVDPRVLSEPDGNLPDDDPFYVLRSADESVVRRAGTGRGETLVIKAPPKMGKSSILIRYRAECQQRGMKFCLADFGHLADAELDRIPALLRQIAVSFGESFGVEPPEEKKFKVPRDLTSFVQNKILPVADTPVVFAFDDVDRVLGKPYQTDFFTMLRMWHENRAKELSGRWKRVGLAMVISTEPYLLISTAHRSPFNVSSPVEPGPFDPQMCATLNERYGSPLSDEEVVELYDLVHGHPYLVRLGLYRVVTKEVASFRDLVARAADYNGPYGEHLRALLLRLRTGKPELLEAMRRLTKSQTAPSQEISDRLGGAGLVRIDEQHRAVPANLVYARFFKGVL